MTRCLACNVMRTDEEIIVDDDLCRKCLKGVYSDFSPSSDGHGGFDSDEEF